MVSNSRPNIVVILTDSHGAWASGCYGSRFVNTPNLDHLASVGVLFEEAYCNNPICLPSRASFLSGTYSCDNGALHNDQPYPDGILTIAHHLRSHGYDTAAIGKMHFVADPECSLGKDRHRGFDFRRDFEEFYWYLRRERGLPPLSASLDNPYQISFLERHQTLLRASLVAPVDRSHRTLGREGTLDYGDHQEAFVLREWRNYLKRPHERPFLAYVSFQSPHSPFVPTSEILRSYDAAGTPIPSYPSQFEQNHPYLAQRLLRTIEAGTDERERFLRYYAAFVTFSDQCIGEAIEALAESGYADNTLVLYHSDHGEMALHHGLINKSVFYDNSVRVPLILHWPGHFEGGWRYRGLVELADVFPTLCDVAGAPKPGYLRGRSLASDLAHHSGGGKEAVFSELYPMLRDQPGFGLWPHRMVCTKEWKYVQYGPEYENLFHRPSDPGENVNLAEDSGLEHVMKHLRDILLDRMGRLPEPEARLQNGYYEQAWARHRASQPAGPKWS